MAKSISVAKARENLRYSAKQVSSSRKKPSLTDAKLRLRDLDEELDLPPLVPYIDKGRWKEATILSASWSVSGEGIKMLSSLFRKILLSR